MGNYVSGLLFQCSSYNKLKHFNLKNYMPNFPVIIHTQYYTKLMRNSHFFTREKGCAARDSETTYVFVAVRAGQVQRGVAVAVLHVRARLVVQQQQLPGGGESG